MTTISCIAIHIDSLWPWRRVRVVNVDSGKTARAWLFWHRSLWRALDEVADDD